MAAIGKVPFYMSYWCLYCPGIYCHRALTFKCSLTFSTYTRSFLEKEASERHLIWFASGFAPLEKFWAAIDFFFVSTSMMIKSILGRIWTHNFLLMRRALKTVELRGLSWQERRSFDSGHVPQFIKMSKRKSKLSTCTSKPSSFF